MEKLITEFNALIQKRDYEEVGKLLAEIKALHEKMENEK